MVGGGDGEQRGSVAGGRGFWVVLGGGGYTGKAICFLLMFKHVVSTDFPTLQEH